MAEDIEKSENPYPNRALIDLKFGGSTARFELEVTPVGLVAVGILVSSILLSVAPIVRAATRHLRGN